MDRDQEALSTADLADRNPAEGGREQEAPEGDTSGPSHSSREATDGRYDELRGEDDSAPRTSREGTLTVSDRGGSDVQPPAHEGSGVTADLDANSPLLEAGDLEHFHDAWAAIQTGFVDEPRRAVERADTLVAKLMQRLAESFAHERSQLEGQWDRGDDVSTEDLRLALQRYRTFFGRLLQA